MQERDKHLFHVPVISTVVPTVFHSYCDTTTSVLNPTCLVTFAAECQPISLVLSRPLKTKLQLDNQHKLAVEFSKCLMVFA